MNGTRNTGFVVSLALLASLVSHIAVHRYFERRALAQSDSNGPRRNPVFFAANERSEAHEFHAVPKFLDHHHHIVPAVDSQEETPRDPSSRPLRSNSEVPSPADTSAADDQRHESTLPADEDESAVRDVIEQELSHATREEREIWFEELRSLPAGVVQELLKVRKQLRALPRVLGGVPEKLASTDPHSHQPHELMAEPASQRIRFNSIDHFASIAALESAISQLRHNLTNAATPGYKRIRVIVMDAYAVSDSSDSTRNPAHNDDILGEGCRTTFALLDVKQGSLKKTARHFDLGIDGEGFFVVRRGDQEFLTRCGTFTLDRERRLCLALSHDSAVLQPPVTIPENTREIQISSDGTITTTSVGEATQPVIGHLKLARVPSPYRLHPVGDSLLSVTEDSGPITIGTPLSNAFGEIHQGFLERSNVDIDREQEEIEELTTILKSLPAHSPRPATANTPNQPPKR